MHDHGKNKRKRPGIKGHSVESSKIGLPVIHRYQQPKIKAKSDLSKVFRPADILGVPQAIKGFDKSDFWEVLNNLRPTDLNPIYKIIRG
jgi:hypothetical protein